MYMLVVAKTCREESMHMVAHASEWDVEVIATDPNDNTIHVDAGMGYSMSMKKDDGLCNNAAAIMEMDQPGITYTK
nr:hypothetical protein [Tanacetum cinerariifolium]